MSCDIGEVMERLDSEQRSTFLSLHLRHNSFSNPSVASTTQFIFQPFFRFSYVTKMSSSHSPTFLSFHLRHNSFSNPSFTLPMPQLILQLFCHFTYVTVHSPTLLSLLRHTSSSLNSPGEPPMVATEHKHCNNYYNSFFSIPIKFNQIVPLNNFL